MQSPINHDPSDASALKKFVTEERWERFNRVLDRRTHYITVVFDHLHKPDNISACLRTCEANGIQDIHIVSENNTFPINRKITQGSHHWLSLHSHTSTPSCLSFLKEKGFLLASTSLSKEAIMLEEIPLSQPVALIFGNELEGISKEVDSMADINFYIPMHGFVQSFNVSVALALSVYSTVSRLHQSDVPWQLDPADKEYFLKKWIKRQVQIDEMK